MPLKKTNKEKNPKSLILLAVILIIAAFLRAYRLNELMVFTSLQGREFLVARDALLSNKLPLVGVESAASGVFQGPIYTWLLMLSFSIFGLRPEPVAMIAALVGILVVWIIYILTEKYWGTSAAVVASLIFATSPLAVVYSRTPSHSSLVPLLSLLFFYCLFKLARSKRDKIVTWSATSAAIWAIATQVKISFIPLILLLPVAILLNIQRLTKSRFLLPTKYQLKKLISSKVILISIIAAIIPFIPRIKFFLSQSPTAAFNIVPLFLRYFQALPKNIGSLALIAQYTRKFFSWGSETIYVSLILLLLLLTAKNLKDIFANVQKASSIFLTLLGVILMLISLVIYGNPSQQQFLIITPLLAIWFGWVMARKQLPKKAQKIALSIAVFVALFNLIFLFNESFLVATSKAPKRHPFKTFGIPLLEQQRIVTKIIQDSYGQPFSIKSPLEAKNDGSLTNFKFLFLRENSPLKADAQLTYTIFSGQKAYQEPKIRFFLFNAATVIRDEPKPSEQ